MNFKVNEDYSVSVHWDNMNPDECLNLIDLIKDNLTLVKSFDKDPVSIMNSSARMANGLITFRLGWGSPEISVYAGDDLPEPNVDLNPEQTEAYFSTLRNMVSGI